MKILYYLHKTFLENIREWKILVMVLTLAPFFVFLMWGYFSAASPVYRMSVLNDDAGGTDGLATALTDAWREAKHPDGKPVFVIENVPTEMQGLEQIETKESDLLVHIPKGFGEALIHLRIDPATLPPRIVNHVDPSNARGSMAGAYSDYIAFTFAFEASGVKPPLDVTVSPVGRTEALSEFDLYVPALLVLAIIMILFTSAASLIREVEHRTMIRLVLSRLTSFQMMLAVSINQVMIGLIALALAVGAAYITGYRPLGAVWRILPVGAIAILGVTAVGVMCAAFLKNMFALLTVGVFPFFIMMFFSECMFPLPKIPLVTLLGNVLYVNDILPTSLAVRAFNRILNHGASFGEIRFELIALMALSALYFAVAMILFKKRV